MNSIPRCSVITIFFNAEPYLAEAIESVLAQTDQDFELLLVDDGSRDDSTAIALDYARRMPQRVRYLAHEGHVNRGMSATRNLGMREARGEFVAFIDADDFWRPEKLADQVAIMRQYPELGAVCGAVNYWRSWSGGVDAIVPTGRVHDAPVAPPETSLDLYPLGAAAAPCPSDLMFRRDILERLGGFEAHFSGPRQLYEDQALLAKLYLEAPVYFSSRVWLDYRQHNESCVSTVTALGQRNKVRRYFLEWFGDYLRRTGHDRNPRVHRAWAKARRRSRHPRLYAAMGEVSLTSLRRRLGAVRRKLMRPAS
jgi:glycosyltransferase involved in cell wall biosynthesis